MLMPSAPAVPSVPSAPSAPVFSQESLHPPTYESCVFGANPNTELGTNFEKGEVIESDSSEFKPLYPVYKDYSI